MSTQQDLPPVPYKTPIAGPSGILTTPWMAWFRQLFNRVGQNVAQLVVHSGLTHYGAAYATSDSDIGTTAAGAVGAVLVGQGPNAAPVFSNDLSYASGIEIHGTVTNDSASAGYVGEHLSANGAGPAVASTGAFANVASKSLTAGDWEVEGVAAVDLSGFTTPSKIVAAISTSTGATDSTSSGGIISSVAAAASLYASTGRRRISLASTATVYLVGAVTYAGGSGNWSTDSFIRARRVR